MYKKKKNMKNLERIHLLFMTTLCVLWPFWMSNGYLDDTYLIVSTFIACYGGLVTLAIHHYDKYYRNEDDK